MRARLLVALLALLAFGAVLDGTVHRFWVGFQTIGQERSAEARAEGIERDRSVPTFVGQAGAPDANDGRHSLYLMMRRTAPGADVAIVASSANVVDLFVHTIGAAADVRRIAVEDTVVAATLERVVEQAGPPDAVGTFRGGTWTLRVADGPPARVVILSRQGVAHVVDARLLPDADALVPGWDEPATDALPTARDVTSARSADEPPRLLRTVVLETLVFALLLLVGGALLPRSLLPTAPRTVLALVVGVGLLGAVGLVLPPGLSGPILVGAVGSAAVLYARRTATPAGWGPGERRVLLLGIAAIAVTVAWSRWFGFLALTADSMVYWAGGAALADGAFGPDLVELKRGVTQQAIHAVGFLLGIEGLTGLGAIVLVAAVALLATVAWESARDHGRWVSGLVVLLPVATLIASPQMRGLAAYLNAHFFVALLLAALIVLLGIQDEAARRGALPAVAVLITAVVTSRAEGSLLVGLVLLGTLALPERDLPWRRAWQALGLATIGWAGLLTLGAAQRGEGLSSAILPLVASGVIALLVPPVLGRVGARQRRAIPAVATGVLWIGVGTLVVIGGENLRFFDAAVENLGRGFGNWGVVGILLLMLSVILITTVTDPRQAPGRWFLAGFVPVIMFVKLGDGLERPDTGWETLLSGGGRVGWSDSVNRMWMHAALVVLLLLVQAVGDQRTGKHGTDGPVERSGSVIGSARGSFVIRSVVLIVLVGWIAFQWQPDHLPRATGVSTTVHATGGDRPIGELVDGSQVSETVLVGDFELPHGTTPAALCAEVRFVTFARSNVGSVELRIALGEATAQRTIRADSFEDWGTAEVCLDLDGPSLEMPGPLDPVTVEVRGIGGPPGESVGVLEGSGAATTIVEVPDGSESVTSRIAGPLVMDLTVVSDPPSAAVSRAVDRSASFLPWVLFLIGVAMLVDDDRRMVRDRTRQRTR